MAEVISLKNIDKNILSDYNPDNKEEYGHDKGSKLNSVSDPEQTIKREVNTESSIDFSTYRKDEIQNLF